MAAIFHKTHGEWRVERLAEKHAALSFAPIRITALEAGSLRCDGTIGLIPLDLGRKWLAMVPDDLRITHNGQLVEAVLRILEHGDVLAAADGAPVFFSAEEAPCVERFAGVQSVSCPRCKSEIEPGQPTVRCPECRVVHHELPDRNCWTYSQTCALCPQPTALDAGLRWTPEAL